MLKLKSVQLAYAQLEKVPLKYNKVDLRER